MQTRMLRIIKELPTRAWVATAALGGALLSTVVQRVADHLVPFGTEGTKFTRTLGALRDMLTTIPISLFLAVAVGALLPYVWDERKRWIGALSRLMSKTTHVGAETHLKHGPGGIFDIRESRNVSSVTDYGVGDASVNFSSPSRGVRIQSMPEAASVPPPRQLTPDQKDRKLRALTKIRDQVRTLHPFINRAERLSSGAWNAFATGAGLEYSEDLRTFRDEFDAATRELDTLRDQYPEYEDAIAATRMPDREIWIRDIGDHLVTSQALFTYLKDAAPNDLFVRLASEDASAFAKFVSDYIRWHGFSRTSLDHLCREVAA